MSRKQRFAESTSRAELRRAACFAARRFVESEGAVLFELAASSGNPLAERAVARLCQLALSTVPDPEALAPHMSNTAAFLSKEVGTRRGITGGRRSDDADVVLLLRRASALLDQLDHVSNLVHRS